jgi:predicted DsbA family dithiol-disulfide isomerase
MPDDEKTTQAATLGRPRPAVNALPAIFVAPRRRSLMLQRMGTKRVTVDVWSDVVCPWCFVGKRRLEAALAGLPFAGSVDVRWHAFELDPSAPARAEGNYVERLARKYRLPTGQAQQMIDRMVSVGREDGIVFDFERAQAGNTFDAHRLMHHAALEGKQGALAERLFLGYFSEGAAVSDKEALAQLAEAAGLDGERARAVLFSDAHAEAVRNDERQAAAMGVRGVPFFVVDGRYAVSGAQPAELLRQALERAWSEAPAPEAVAEGAACDADGCD